MNPLGEIALTSYGQASTQPAPVNRMMADFAVDFRDGVDINLGVGYVNESTIPRQQFQEALEAVLRRPQHHRAAFNYGGPVGSANLIEAIKQFHGSRPGGVPEKVMRERAVIVGGNGATSLLEGMAAVLKPGIVVVTDPMYYIYCNFLARLGFELLPIAEDEEGMSAAGLAATLERLGQRREEISFVYVVTVHNPTATVLSTRRRHDLVKAVSQLSRRLGRKIPLVVDRAYEELIHDPGAETPEAASGFDEMGLVFEVGTLSKILAPALRIGYLIGPPGPFVDALVQHTSDAGFSAPLINQEIASHLLEHHAPGQIRAVNEGYAHKARLVRAFIDEKLGAAVDACTGGRAGFYFYLTLAGIETGVESPLFRCMSRRTGETSIDRDPDGDTRPRVIYIPGQFCVHPAGELVDEGRRQLRISYGFEEVERIRQAVELMAEGMAWARGR